MNLLMERIAANFLDDEDGEVIAKKSFFDEPIADYIKKQRDVQWIYERTSGFKIDIDCEPLHQAGKVNTRLGLTVQQAHIAEVEKINNLLAEANHRVRELLIDQPFLSNSIEKLKQLISNEMFINNHN